MNKEIKDLRDKIDRADREITRLLNERAGYALNIGRIKRKLNLPVYMPEREKQVIENVCGHNPGPLSNDAITRLYERIIDESRRLEREHSERSGSNE